MPSRFASEDELEALCRVVGEFDGMSLELITTGCINRFSSDEVDFLARLSVAAGSPLNWNVLTVDSREPGRIPHQLGAGDRAAENGARIVALTMPVLVPMNMSFLNHCGLFLIPGWSDVLGLPVPERMAELAGPLLEAAAEIGAASSASQFFSAARSARAGVEGAAA